MNLLARTCGHPYIVRLEGGGPVQYYILMENMVFMEATGMQQALLLLFATYFTFNIKYPRFISPLYEFIQHHILNQEVKKSKLVTVMQTYTMLVSFDEVNTA